MGSPIKGFDENKKINGRMGHIVLDTQGLLMTIVVVETNVHDSIAAERVL